MSKDLEENLQWALAQIEALTIALHSTLEAMDREAANARHAVFEDLESEATSTLQMKTALEIKGISRATSVPMKLKAEALTELADQLKGHLRKG